MNEKLKAFKMKKSQMNKVAGGGVTCYVFNRETQQEVYLYFKGDDLDGIRNQVVNQYGAPHNVACWSVFTDPSIIVDP